MNNNISKLVKHTFLSLLDHFGTSGSFENTLKQKQLDIFTLTQLMTAHVKGHKQKYQKQEMDMGHIIDM